MEHGAGDYPELANLMASYFHQDFDLEGDSLEEVVTAYASTASTEARASLVADIDQFLEHHPEDRDEAFERIFAPDVDVLGFAPSTAAFLARVRNLVQTLPSG